MTLYCSSLPNDQDMIRALGSLAIPLPSLFTDCCFAGVGDNDTSLLVSIERKKIGDICSCILDGRFLFQAQVCKEAGADVLCLIVEGACRPSPADGLLEVPVWGINTRGRRAEIWRPVMPAMTYSRFDQYLTELDYLAGIIIKRSRGVRETAAIIKALWVNFQTPPSEHQSLHQMFTAPAPAHNVELMRPGLVRRMAKEIDGIGWKRSKAVAAHFPTPKAMCDAGVEEWLSLDGIGKKTAARVVRSLQGNC